MKKQKGVTIKDLSIDDLTRVAFGFGLMPVITFVPGTPPAKTKPPIKRKRSKR